MTADLSGTDEGNVREPVTSHHTAHTTLAHADDAVTVHLFDIDARLPAIVRVAPADEDGARMIAQSRALAVQDGPQRLSHARHRAVAAAMVAARRRASPVDRALLWGLTRR